MKSQNRNTAHRSRSRGGPSPAGGIIAGAAILFLTAGAADAQIFQNIPTTTTLWAGTQNFAADGLASVTSPGSGVILTGTKISSITHKPIRFLWYGDTSNGLCRVDPEVDAIIPPLNGIGGHQNNILTCIGSIRAAAFTPGQVAFDGSTNTLYIPDVGRTTAGLIRVQYDPSGDGGNGSLNPVTVTSLMGTTLNRNAAGGCPQIKSPKTGNNVPLVPTAAAIGPDGAVYFGGARDGAVIRIKNAGTFDPSNDADCRGGIDIPILSADSRVTAGHVFGLGWIGHTLMGNDNIAPWVEFNADQCLTPANGNRICGSPAVSGAPLPTEILASFVPGPQAAGASDAQFPNFTGNIFYTASFPSVTKISNIASPTNLSVQTQYGGAFSFVTGLTPDPEDLVNANLYVGVDPSQGTINGAASIWLVTEQAPPPAAPLAPINPTAAAQSVLGATTGSVGVSWTVQTNGQPITSYVAKTFLAPATPGLTPTPSSIPDVTVTPVNSVLATTATVGGLTFHTGYQFAVEACNLTGCSPVSGFSNAVTATPVTAPPAPTNVLGLAGNLQAIVSWTQGGTGGSPITTSTVSAFNSPSGTPASAALVVGSATGGTATGLVNGNCYTFTVHAVNAAGISPESAHSPAVCLPNITAVDLAVSLSAPASINAGSILTYSMTVSNVGPSNVVQTLIGDTLPAPIAGFTATQGICQGSAGTFSFTCNLGGLLTGSSATVTVSVALPTSLTSGSVPNTVQVSAADATGALVTDTNPANNSASTVTAINNVAPSVTTDIQVGGSSNNGNPVHGSPVTFTWQIKDNQGTVNAPGAVFTSQLPASFQLVSVSPTQGTCSGATGSLGATVTCSLGTVNGGTAALVTVVAVPTVPGPANSFISTGSATFSGTDSNTANNSFSVAIGAQ